MPSRADRRWWSALVVAASAGMLTSCSDGGSTSHRAVVEVFGNVVGDAGQRLGAALRHASANSSIELRYVGVTSFSEQLTHRLDQADRPGIVLLPQPGRLADLVRRGLIRPLDDDMVSTIENQYDPGLVSLTSVDGRPAAVALAVDVKGLVWYRPSVFEDRGLSIPRTLDELAAVAEKERTDGDSVAPFCVTMEAGSSTGWVGTDWVESYVARRLGPDQYDAWTSGLLSFDSPQITAVFAELDVLLRSPGAISGGGSTAITTPWEFAADQLLGPTTPCLMVHQGDFLRREFPAGTTIGPTGDVDFFVLPAADGSPPPQILGGLLAAPMQDSPAVSDAMKILASPQLAAALVRTGEFLSPHRGVDWSTIGDPTSVRLEQLIGATAVVRFDGSDLMPPAIGTGTFWSGMRAFISGEPLPSVLALIESGRPVAAPTGS